MARRGLFGEDAKQIYVQILSFANFGFAESHALSFAKLVYASSWFKLHYPGVFLAALLRAQPMGFYSPQSLTQDARRHGVDVRGASLVRSGAQAVMEPVDAAGSPDSPPVVAPAAASDRRGRLPDPASDHGGRSCDPAAPTGIDACLHDSAPEPWVAGTPDPTPVHRRDTN